MREVVESGSNVFLFQIFPLQESYFSDETLKFINGKVQLFTITLERIKGDKTVLPWEFSSVVNRVAEFMLKESKAVLCYYCDFLNPIPSIRETRDAMTAQEYRSKLFSALFERYTHNQGLLDYNEVVLAINGVDEMFFIHMIAHTSLASYTSIIANDLQKGYGKE